MGSNIPKQMKTQQLLKDAFMKIYSQKNYFNITVKEICQEAGVHRSTFYLHYENIDSLLREIEDILLEQIKDVSNPLNRYNFNNNFSKKMYFNDDMYNLLYFYQKNRDYVIPLLSVNGNQYFSKKLKEIIIKSFVESLNKSQVSFGKNQEYILIYLSSGIIDTIYAWLKNNDKSIEEITELFMKLNYFNPSIIS